jgi:3-phenylpropionate/cinnamic acid dioxygenase small subunit
MSGDTSSTSHVDAELYAWLQSLDASAVRIPRPDLRGGVEDFLIAEAALLDDGEFETWYSWFGPKSIYWVPISHPGENPGRSVSVAFDDHRRLGDRLAWMRTGDVYSHQPPAATQRLISNVQVWTLDDDLVLSRSAFVLYAHRRDTTDRFVGRYEHVLELVDGVPSGIRVKKVLLLDRLSPLHNLTIIL